MRTIFGSCHCRAVNFEITTDESLGPYFCCNCSLCSRKSAVMGETPRSSLRVTAGLGALSAYVWNTGEAPHYFCKVCGIHTHHVMRGRTDTFGVNMACIAGVDIYTLADIDIVDGRHLAFD